jgi:hypothetical protein
VVNAIWYWVEFTERAFIYPTRLIGQHSLPNPNLSLVSNPLLPCLESQFPTERDVTSAHKRIVCVCLFLAWWIAWEVDNKGQRAARISFLGGTVAVRSMVVTRDVRA